MIGESALRSTRRTRWMLAGATLALAITFAALAAPSFRFTGDTEAYVELARGLVHGGPYAVNGHPEAQFPPGVPLLLAPAAVLFHGSFEAISRWAAAWAALVLPLTWFWVRRREPKLAWPIAILTVGSIPFLSLSTDNPMSELLYMVVALGLLLWGDEWATAPSSRRGWGWIVTGSALLVAAPASRAIGIAAVAATALFLLLRLLRPGPSAPRFRFKETIPLLAGVAFLAGWLSWTVSVASRVGRTGYLQKVLMANPHHPDAGLATPIQLLSRIGQNLENHVAHAGEIMTPVIWIKPSWFSPLSLLLAGLVIGWWWELTGPRKFGPLYLLCYVGILLLWPYDEGARFLLPAAPLLWFYGIDGGRRMIGAVREGWPWVRILILTLSVASLIGVAVTWGLHPEMISRQDLAALGFWSVVLVAATTGWSWLVRGIGVSSRLPAQAVVLSGVGVFVLASVVQVGPMVIARAKGKPPTDENARALWEASDWIKTNTAPTAMIETTYATRIHFATGRPTVKLPVTERRDTFVTLARHYRPEFVVILDSEDGYYVPSDRARFRILESLFPGRWREVHRFAGGSIHAFR